MSNYPTREINSSNKYFPVTSDLQESNTPGYYKNDMPYGTIQDQKQIAGPSVILGGSILCCKQLWAWLFLGLCGIMYVLSNVNFSGYGECFYRGVDWDALPKQIEYQSNGLTFQVVGGSLSGGKITIVKDVEGFVEMKAKVSPSNLLENPELSSRLVHYDNKTTLFEIHVPRHLPHHYPCVYLEAIVHVPADLEYLDMFVQNTEYEIGELGEILDINHMNLKTTNGHINFFSNWQGNDVVLKSTNGKIDIQGSLSSKDQIQLITTNHGIRTRKEIVATQSIELETTNGPIDADQLLESPMLKLTSTNSHVFLENIKANETKIQTTNGRIQLIHGSVESSIVARNTNSAVDFHLDECQFCKATISSSNAGITATLPKDHEGSFDIQTSSYQHIVVKDDLNWAKFKRVEKSHVTGERYDGTQKEQDGRVLITTTHGNINISF